MADVVWRLFGGFFVWTKLAAQQSRNGTEGPEMFGSRFCMVTLTNTGYEAGTTKMDKNGRHQ